MADWHDLKNLLQRIEHLERKLSLQDLQINSLLSISQAVNENVRAEGLFDMYVHFLRWDMQLRRVALLVRDEGQWQLKVQHEADTTHFTTDPVLGEELAHLSPAQRRLSDAGHPFLQQFEIVLPVFHKNIPLAYLLIGDLQEEELGSKMKLITTLTNIVVVALENKRMFKDQMAQKVVHRELELAAEIQQALVPRRLPASASYELSSIYKPHFAVGGDYFDVVEFPDGKFAFCIADITGKGVSAALLMANFQASFYALVTKRPTLEELVHELNAAVHRVTDGERFITLFLGKYDTVTRTLHYVNAGHTPPFLLMDGTIERLRNGTTVLGWLPDLPFVEIGGVCLTGDATLFSYTDGLTDLRNRAGEDFNEDLLGDFLQAHNHLSVKELNAHLLNHIEVFREREPYPDDITVLTCRVFV